MLARFPSPDSRFYEVHIVVMSLVKLHSAMRCCGSLAMLLLGAGLASALIPETALSADSITGHVAVWHHHKPVLKTVVLPPFTSGHYLADALVQVGPLPESLQPDIDGCFCYDVNDDRLAYVHTYYYAHQVIADYNVLLRELRLPQLRDVVITLTKDQTRPTFGVSWRKKRPHTALHFSSPALDPFTIAHEMAHLIDYTIGGRYKQKSQTTIPSLRQQAEEDGVAEGTASILAALELGTTGNLPYTSETLDAPPANDVDSFVRFPDLMISRRQVLRDLVSAPRFAARYAQHVYKLQQSLEDPMSRELLAQPDENTASAVINQPLWQAAVRFGFKPAKILYLKTLAGWASPEVGYVALGRELVITAQELGPKWAAFLSEEYRRRGLPVPDTHIDVRQN